MIRVYLDTNVLIDWIVTKDRPNREASLLIAQAVLDRRIEGFISSQSLVDTAYVAQRAGCDFSCFVQLFKRMLRVLNLGGFTYGTMMSALDHPTGDFEDDAQFQYADSLFCRFFVTGDADFARQHAAEDMEILSPGALIQALRQ